MRDNNQRDTRDSQPYQRDQQPREHRGDRDIASIVRSRNFSRSPQPQPVIADMSASTACRLSSPARSRRSMAARAAMKAVAAASAFRAGGAGRTARVPTAWPRRPRPGDDFNPGNE